MVFAEKCRVFVHAFRAGDVVPGIPDQEQPDENAQKQKGKVREALGGT
jgi:hypothetical protein